MNGRKWSDLSNDEIFAIWAQYIRSEGLYSYDALRADTVTSRPMRITVIEMIKLVEELLNRLEAKHG